jgi:hypothetical protein
VILWANKDLRLFGPRSLAAAADPLFPTNQSAVWVTRFGWRQYTSETHSGTRRTRRGSVVRLASGDHVSRSDQLVRR